MIYAESEIKLDQTKKLQKLLNRALKENWEGVINDILQKARENNIKLKK